jgi:hypothetical protein
VIPVRRRGGGNRIALARRGAARRGAARRGAALDKN